MLIYLPLLTIYAQPLSSSNYRTLGIKAHTTGWGFDYVKFTNNLLPKIEGFSLEYMNQNIFGERKINTETLTNAKMVINKVNNLYFLKAGVLKNLEIGRRESYGNIGVNAIFNAGPMLALYKPIYIEYSSSDSSLSGISLERYNPQIHRASQVVNRSRFLTGIGQTIPKLGFHLTSSFRIDWGVYETNFKALEIGVNTNYVINASPIIYGLKNNNLFTNVFIKLSFGRVED